MLWGLALMLLVSALSFAMLQSVGLEEKLAYQERDRQVAFQAAEAALRHAESLIEGNKDGLFSPLRESNFPAACANGLCRSSPASEAWRRLPTSAWREDATVTQAYLPPADTVATVALAAPPRYLIEYQGGVTPIEPGAPCVARYLITVRANGLSAQSVVTLQSQYRRRTGSCQRTL
jgi:type IV pilus assembly protein PilX